MIVRVLLRLLFMYCIFLNIVLVFATQMSELVTILYGLPKLVVLIWVAIFCSTVFFVTAFCMTWQCQRNLIRCPHFVMLPQVWRLRDNGNYRLTTVWQLLCFTVTNGYEGFKGYLLNDDCADCRHFGCRVRYGISGAKTIMKLLKRNLMLWNTNLTTWFLRQIRKINWR